MRWYIAPRHIPYLGDDISFSDVMALEGEVFRDQDGRRTLRFERKGESYFVKLHRGVGWREIFKNLLAGRLPIISAKNEWRAIKALHGLSVPTMELVGFGLRGWNPARLKSFVITKELADTQSLEDYCAQWKTRQPDFRHKQSIIEYVATVARTIHEYGLNHRDFYICHFLLDLVKLEQNELQLYLIDLHRMQIRKKIPQRWRIKDLAGIYFSAMDVGLTQRDYLRFLRSYRQRPLRQILVEEGDFWHSVSTKATKLYHKTNRSLNNDHNLARQPQI